MKQVLDFVIIGGGLAGCLTFMALKKRHPGLRLHLFERNSDLCGNHTWCFHEADIPPFSEDWLRPLISKSWKSQEVHFPEYSRLLHSPYHCIQAEDLSRRTRASGGNQIHLEHEFESVEETAEGHYRLHFKDREPVITQSYVLAQGWKNLEPGQAVGWQKFVGLEVRLKKPHGLEHVILKDVRQPQIDGYRFFYVLPLSPTELLVEDTYYSNHSILKDERIEKEVLSYIQKQGWEIDQVLRRETGALPLYMSLPPTRVGPHPEIGAGSYFVHPVTGYSTPMTLRMIEALLERSNLTVHSLQKVFQTVRDQHRSQLRYFAMLNRMLFLAAKNETRYKILEKFYRFPESLIERFYSGRLSWWDRLRILSGQPPVPVRDAMRAIRGRARSDAD